MNCPTCKLEQGEGRETCGRCGLDFQKYRRVLERREERRRQRELLDRTGLEGGQSVLEVARSKPLEPLPSETLQIGSSPLPRHLDPVLPPNIRVFDDFDDEPASQWLDRDGWIALGVGLLIAIGLPFFPFLEMILHPLTTLFHEIGHSLFAWLAGIPAIPSFDFMEGGGLTRWFRTHPHPLLILLAWGGLGFAIYTYRKQKLSVVVFSVIWLLHVIYLFTWIREPVILFMGKGMELVFGGVFLYRGLGGWGCVQPSLERPLYAGLGLWTIFRVMTFSHALINDPIARHFYRQGKASVASDLVRLTEVYRLHTSLDGLARFLIFCSVVTLILTFAAFRYRRYILAALVRVFGIVRS